jgi:hypothetical protein
MEGYGVLTDVCTNEKIFWYNFVMDVLLTGFQMFKINNCVTLGYRNTEMYSRIFVAI